MASSIPIAPPEKFDFKKPDGWPKWHRRFEQFLSASGLEKESDTRRVSTLLYCLGEDAEDVLASTNIADEDRKKYDKVVSAFEVHFKIRRNVIVERARFNKRNQMEGESAEEYITVLYGLIETCEFGALKEQLLKDRLVVGIRNGNLSDALQMDAKLTLEEAKKKIRQKEAIKEQTQLLQDADHGHKNVDELKPHSRRGGPSCYRGRPRGTPRDQKPSQTRNKCTRCGQPQHQPGANCPAKT